MAELTWTVEAERWLRDIYDYIALDNPSAAARTIETIYLKAEILRTFPESGYRYWQKPDRHIRILLHGHYRIAYRSRAQKRSTSLASFMERSILIGTCSRTSTDRFASRDGACFRFWNWMLNW